MSPHDLLSDAIPQLTQQWQSVPDARRGEVVGLVFAPELADDLPPGEPTAFLLPREVIRQGLLAACQQGGNPRPLEAFDRNLTDGEQLVIVVFAPGVVATYVLRRGPQVVLEVN